MPTIKNEEVAIEHGIVATSDRVPVTVSLEDLESFLDNAIKLDSIAVSLKLTRSLPTNQYNNNSYFASLSIDTGSAFAVKCDKVDPIELKKTINKKIFDKVNNAFAFMRVLFKKQLASDGIPANNLGEFDEAKPK